MSTASCAVMNTKHIILIKRVPRRSKKFATLHESRRSSSQISSLSLSSPLFSANFLMNSNGSSKKPPPRSFRPVMQWQDVTVKTMVNAPASVAYKLYSDHQLVPKWMPFCSSVEVSRDNPNMSRFWIKLESFGHNIEYNFLAKNLQPIPNEKIHWKSLEGFANRGTVRFFPRGPSSCLVEMNFAFQVPMPLAPFSLAMKPFMENLLRGGMERFAVLAKAMHN